MASAVISSRQSCGHSITDKIYIGFSPSLLALRLKETIFRAECQILWLNMHPCNNINGIELLIDFGSKYRTNINNILIWNMKIIIHCTWGPQLLEKRQYLFANANDSCLCIYELIAVEMKNPYPYFRFTVKRKSQIATFVAISPFISNIFYCRFIPIFLTYCLKVAYFKCFSLAASMERSIPTIKRNKEKYFRIVMTS